MAVLGAFDGREVEGNSVLGENVVEGLSVPQRSTQILISR